MLEAGEDPKFIARRMVIFASELKVPSGRGHAAPASLVNLKKLEDRGHNNRCKCLVGGVSGISGQTSTGHPDAWSIVWSSVRV
jgi:hypothetical protein